MYVYSATVVRALDRAHRFIYIPILYMNNDRVRIYTHCMYFLHMFIERMLYIAQRALLHSLSLLLSITLPLSFSFSLYCVFLSHSMSLFVLSLDASSKLWPSPATAPTVRIQVSKPRPKPCFIHCNNVRDLYIFSKCVTYSMLHTSYTLSERWEQSSNFVLKRQTLRVYKREQHVQLFIRSFQLLSSSSECINFFVS